MTTYTLEPVAALTHSQLMRVVRGTTRALSHRKIDLVISVWLMKRGETDYDDGTPAGNATFKSLMSAYHYARLHRIDPGWDYGVLRIGSTGTTYFYDPQELVEAMTSLLADRL